MFQGLLERYIYGELISKRIEEIKQELMSESTKYLKTPKLSNNLRYRTLNCSISYEIAGEGSFNVHIYLYKVSAGEILQKRSYELMCAAQGKEVDIPGLCLLAIQMPQIQVRQNRLNVHNNNPKQPQGWKVGKKSKMTNC